MFLPFVVNLADAPRIRSIRRGGTAVNHGQASHPLLSPPYSLLSSALPALLPEHHSAKHRTPRPMTEIPPIPPGNQVLAHAISRASTPRLTEPVSPSPAARTSPLLAFLGDIFADTRDALCLDPSLVPNLSPNPLHTISASKGSILSILYGTVSGIVTINKLMDEANTTLKELQKQNEELRTQVHDLFSKIANEAATAEDVRNLNNAIRDVSHRISAPTPPEYSGPPSTHTPLKVN